jgi:hypothetical protein
MCLQSLSLLDKAWSLILGLEALVSGTDDVPWVFVCCLLRFS